MRRAFGSGPTQTLSTLKDLSCRPSYLFSQSVILWGQRPTLQNVTCSSGETTTQHQDQFKLDSYSRTLQCRGRTTDLTKRWLLSTSVTAALIEFLECFVHFVSHYVSMTLQNQAFAIICYCILFFLHKKI